MKRLITWVGKTVWLAVAATKGLAVSLFRFDRKARLALKNLWRNPRRSVIAVISVFFAVLCVIFAKGLVDGMTDNIIKNTIYMDSGHVKITAKRYHQNKKMMPLYFNIREVERLQRTLRDRLDDYEDVRLWPRTRFGFLISHNGKNKGCLGIALDPAQEKDDNPILGSVQPGGTLIAADKVYVEKYDKSYYQVLVGSALADSLGFRVGDKLTIICGTAEESLGGMTFVISGRFHYGVKEVDERMVYIPLAAGMEMLKMYDATTELLVMVDDKDQAGRAAKRINTMLEKSGRADLHAYSWDEQSGLLGMMRVAQGFYDVIYLVFVVLASLVVLNTMMMVVIERKQEIGTWRALGMDASDVIVTFLLEAFYLSLFGSILGGLAGIGVLLHYQENGINMVELMGGGEFEFGVAQFIFPAFDPTVVLFAVILGVVITTAGSFFMTLKAARMNVIDALRNA